jgi:hypothetical protein
VVRHVGWGPARCGPFAYEEISSYLMVAKSPSHQTVWGVRRLR